MPDGGDIFFDVDDSITSAKNDAQLDAFTFRIVLLKDSKMFDCLLC